MSAFAIALKTPWGRMIAVDAVLILAILFSRARPRIAWLDPILNFHYPALEYLHLIVDYQFGFAKRALIGALISLFLPVVPVWLVYLLGSVVWLIALGLFLLLFKQTFGFDRTALPLFAFMFGSPFFFKNFMHNIGYFDTYGCVAALVMLLVPARSFLYVMLGALLGMVLILIHPIHMLMYMPVIGLIVVMRYYLSRTLVAAEIIGGLLLISIVVGLFLVSAFYGRMPVPQAQLVEYLRTRTADPAFLDSSAPGIWYHTIAEEIAVTWELMPKSAARFPIFAFWIAMHWPVIRYMRRLIDALESSWHRRLTLLGIAGISVGYVIIGMVVFDYSRWVSNWAVCMFLLLHAIKLLPSRETAPLIADDKWTRVMGWVITAMPRMGTVRPF